MLTLTAASERLHCHPDSLRRMLRHSDRGLLVIRGQSVTIAYHQGGPLGQGKILIDEAEANRLLALMSVRPLVQTAQRNTPESFGGVPAD